MVPEKGMQAIPEQIAAHLEAHQIRLNTAVEKIEGRHVFLKNGEKIEADKIVLATDARATARLLHQAESVEWNSTDCLYLKPNSTPPQYRAQIF
ncbi:MAG: FAD-dependent oxidoreductase [Saprospiraceae bacterium]|nr:FAD-dependent oxidoreductase [Saprospiraceae bacterium]